MGTLIELAKYTNASAHLELNPHKGFYEDAKSYFTDREMDLDKIGEIDWSKDIWTLQVYPKTPVGFIQGISNDVNALIDWAIEGAKGY